MVVNPIKILYKTEQEDRIEKFVLCQYISGNFADAIGLEWTSAEYKSHGTYIQTLIKIDDLKNYNIVPSKVKEQLFKDLEKDKTLNSINETKIV